MLKGQHGGNGLEASGRTEAMADHGFNPADGNFPGPLPEHPLDAPGFSDVIELRSRAVGVDRIDLLRFDSRVMESQTDDPLNPFSVRFGSREVMGIGKNYKEAFQKSKFTMSR